MGFQMGRPNAKCSGCGHLGEPEHSSRVTTDGWIKFVVLLIFCFPLCWLGLLQRETYMRCPNCGSEMT
jgi:hypothetical protein